MIEHSYSLTSGPVDEPTSISIVHEAERPPTRLESIIDRVLFWRPSPRRVDRVEITYPRLERQGFDFDADGRVVMALSFTAQAPEAPEMKATPIGPLHASGGEVRYQDAAE